MRDNAPPLLHRLVNGISRGDTVILGIAFGAAVFYLPFLSRQFMGDDWLWLFNAKRATADPIVFLERPMYGYFRPLNLLIMWTWYHLFGPNPELFSLVNILLHAANVWLLWRTLRRFGAAEEIAIGASFLFAFYYLNCSAIEWISVGHDLWVTAFSLLMAIKTADFADDPRPKHFIALALLGAAATLTKESGFVTLGIYFTVLALRGKSPFDRARVVYTAVLTIGYLGFLIPYSLTRSVVDKEVEIGLGTLVNVIYFLVYLILPLSKRVVALVPAGWTWVLQLLKTLSTIALPVVAYFAWKRGGQAVRLYLVWSVMFVSTIAILEWNLGLFDLHPENTVTRFMYSPALGLAVIVAWAYHIAASRFRWLAKPLTKGILTAGYVVANLSVVTVVSQEFVDNQKLTRRVLEQFESVSERVAVCDSVIVTTDRLDALPQLLRTKTHLQAILSVQFDREVGVRVVEIADSDVAIMTNPQTIVLSWNSQENRFHRGPVGE